MQKNIIVFSNTAWSVNNFRLNLMEHLRDEGHKISFMSGKDEYTLQLEARGFEFHDVGLKPFSTNLFREIKTLISLFFLIRRMSPCTVLSFTMKPNIYSGICALFLDIEVITNISGLGRFVGIENSGPKRFALLKLYKFAFSRVKHVFFQNKESWNLFQQKGICELDNSSLLPGSGVEVKKTWPEIVGQRIEKHDSNFDFGFAGRFLKSKGLPVFLAASSEVAKSNPNVRFHICGWKDSADIDAVTDEVLKKYLSDSRYKFYGKLNDMSDFFRKVSCLVHPTFYNEGTPRVLLEAGSLGIPSITTDRPGCNFAILNGHNGILVPPRDVDAVAKAMLSVINMETRNFEMMSQNAFRRVNKVFNEQHIFKSYKKIINE